MHDRIADWVLSLNEVLAWYTGVVYQGHTLKPTADGWMLVVRGKKKDEPLVAFVYGSSPHDCFLALAGKVGANMVAWKADRFAGQ